MYNLRRFVSGFLDGVGRIHRGIFVKWAVPIQSAMIVAFDEYMGLIGRIGYVKYSNRNYH